MQTQNFEQADKKNHQQKRLMTKQMLWRLIPVLSRKVENKVGDSPGPPPSCKQQPGWPIFQNARKVQFYRTTGIVKHSSI